MPALWSNSEILHWLIALIGVIFLFMLLLGSPDGVFIGTPPWLAPSEVLLGRFLLQISPLGISIITCVNLLEWLVVFLVMDSVMHELNPAQNELLHLWRTFLACWTFWGKNIPCLILVPLLFCGCITYGICSVTWLVLCTIRIIHVVKMMLYHLAYCELLFLLLLGLTVCGCNQSIQIYGCRLIGGDKLLNLWAD